MIDKSKEKLIHNGKIKVFPDGRIERLDKNGDWIPATISKIDVHVEGGDEPENYVKFSIYSSRMEVKVMFGEYLVKTDEIIPCSLPFRNYYLAWSKSQLLDNFSPANEVVLQVSDKDIAKALERNTTVLGRSLTGKEN